MVAELSTLLAQVEESHPIPEELSRNGVMRVGLPLEAIAMVASRSSSDAKQVLSCMSHLCEMGLTSQLAAESSLRGSLPMLEHAPCYMPALTDANCIRFGGRQSSRLQSGQAHASIRAACYLPLVRNCPDATLSLSRYATIIACNYAMCQQRVFLFHV